MSLKLLAVGDIHLGRQPSRLPEELAGEAVELSPTAAWHRLVDRAIEDGVDIVALAGDVVEREDDYYEAYRELSQGVEKLSSAGIHIVGVAGNHDFHVLPRLADQISDFQLIGRGGKWQVVPLEAGGETVRLHGWSFRQNRVFSSPLEGESFEKGSTVDLGLLHCNLDAPGSPYAPVSTTELQRTGLDGWLLGHIHKPHALNPGNPTGYLGCISGMDPGEPGDHGPWLFTIEGGRIRDIEQWILAPLRWESMELDLLGLARAEEARDRLLTWVRERDYVLAGLQSPPIAVGLRVRLTGRTALGRSAEEKLDQDAESVIYDGSVGTRYFIERCVSETRPEIAMEDLAQRSDPPGLLARRLCLLNHPGTEEGRELIEKARTRLERQRKDARWQSLRAAPLDDTAVIDLLRRSGTRLLEDMLKQLEEPRR